MEMNRNEEWILVMKDKDRVLALYFLSRRYQLDVLHHELHHESPMALTSFLTVRWLSLSLWAYLYYTISG